MWYRYRRGPRGIHSLWFLFIPLFFFAGHSFFGLLIWISVIIAISLIGRAIMASLSGASTWGPRSNPYYQQPYQQNPYQHYQQPYQSYKQGYQPQPEMYQEGGQQQQYPQQQQYDQYEQPQAQYPQEMPPMHQ